ncbi:MAG: tetratricopeptide repeat protein [Bryobacteraceae bacterium]
MSFWRGLLPALLVFPSLSMAASREMMELQREVAQIEELVRSLQRSQDEKLGMIQVLAQQALDAANKSYTAVSVLQDKLQQTISDQQKKVVEPVVGVGSKIDQMSNDFQALRESVADLSSRMGKLQQQVIDIGNAVKTIQAPAAPPPGTTGGMAGGFSPAGGAPPVSAETLYQNAMRDRSGGKDDLALQEFADYLKYYGNTDLAPNAQFYVAELHLRQNNLDDALREFDMVLEKYPDNNKTADALYMKGTTLVKMGKRTQGKQEYCELVKRFPSSDLASRAKAQVKSLGLTCGPATPARARRRS